MARTPDYVRLATTASRTLAETAFDSVREAVLIVDTRPKHMPVVVANAAARRCLAPDADPGALIESSLYGLLGAVSASAIEGVLAAVPESGESSLTRSLAWRFSHGESAVPTELKRLDSSPGRRLIMLTLAAASLGSDLANAADQLPFDLMILDSSLDITYANGGAVRSSGIAGSLIGCSALGVTPTCALPREIYERGLDGCHYHHDALELRASAGPSRRFEIDIQPLRSPAGIAGLIVLGSEVGERRIARTPQSAGERHLRALIEHAQDTTSVAAADGRLLYVSSGAKDATHHASADTSYIFDFLDPEDAAALRTEYSQLVSGAINRFTCQHRVRCQNGSYRWMESSYVSGLDNPHINGVAIFSRDITKRKQAELHLAQREEVFRLAADAVNGVIFEWDLTRGFVHRSRGMSEILGIEPEDLAPVVDAWRERIHPRDLEGAIRQIGLALIQGRGWTTSYRIRDAHGRYRSMLERGLIQRNANGDPVRAIGCCVDVSEIKRLTDLLGEAQRTAQIGGWEYSHSTLELTWTDELFRIYETTPGEFLVSWDSALAQCTPESRQHFQDAWKRAESSDGQIDLELEINTLKNRRIWVRMIGHMEKLDGRSVRAFGSVQNIQAQKLAQIALEQQHGLAQALDDHGAHARLALGQGERCVRVRDRGRSAQASADHVTHHESVHGERSSQGPALGNSQHRGCLSRAHRAAHRVSPEGERARLPLVHHDRAADLRCGRRAARARRREPRTSPASVSRRRSSGVPSSSCVPPPRTRWIRCCWSITTCASGSSTAPAAALVLRISSAARSRRCSPNPHARW